MAKRLFRRGALERRSSPEQFDSLMQITSSRGRISLAAVGVLLACILIWGSLGSISVRVTGQGMLVRPGGIYEIVSESEGVIKGIYFESGDLVESGQTVAMVDRFDSLQSEVRRSAAVTSPFSGRVLELTIGMGQLVRRGTPILKMEPIGVEGGGLRVVMYFPAGAGEKIRQGMAAQIAPLGAPRAEYGFLKGVVTRVSKYPSSREGIMRHIQNEVLVQTLLREGAPIEVHADLILDSSTTSGYAWSSSKGPDIYLQTGTLCSVSVTVSRLRPLELFIPSAGKPSS